MNRPYPACNILNATICFFRRCWRVKGLLLSYRFIQHNIDEFKKVVDITNGKNLAQNADIVVEFVANAYVGVVEWWLKNDMPHSPKEMQKKWEIY